MPTWRMSSVLGSTQTKAWPRKSAPSMAWIWMVLSLVRQVCETGSQVKPVPQRPSATQLGLPRST